MCTIDFENPCSGARQLEWGLLVFVCSLSSRSILGEICLNKPRRDPSLLQGLMVLTFESSATSGLEQGWRATAPDFLVVLRSAELSSALLHAPPPPTREGTAQPSYE